MNQEIISLVKELQKYDNKEGYELDYDRVKRLLNNTILRLVYWREDAIEYLHPLLQHIETWSCLFTLEILRAIRSEKSIPYLIKFLIDNKDTDYWECSEEAMFCLTEIGKPSIELLIKEIKKQFENKEYYIYLIGALTEIKDERVYSFMVEILLDYMENYEKYEEWFWIDAFVHDFPVQENKDVLPLLKELVAKEYLTKYEIIEIKDTILLLEDPEEYKRQMEEFLKKFKLEEDKEKKKIGRNEPCPCGSGKKYKKCCLGKKFE